MTEEVKPDVVEPKEEVVEPQPSSVEQTALDQGWLPKDKWIEAGREENEWRSAREFRERGDFFQTIHQLKRENKQTQAALSALQKHHQFVFDQAHRSALSELRKERREALRSDDIDRAEKIDEQIEAKQEEFQTAKTQLQQEQQAANVAGPPPEFQAWSERNGWYLADDDLRDFADAAGMVYTKRNPTASPQRVLDHVENEVKKKFPEKFGVRKTAPNPTASVNRTSGGIKKTQGVADLPDEARDIMRTLIRSGALTEKQYLDEYFGRKD